jgi:hypothetical protein
LFEFIQAQLPMIANDSPELRRFVNDTGFGKVGAMTNPIEIANLVNDFMNDFECIYQAKSFLTNKSSDFSWQYQKQTYLNAINDTLEPI